MNIDAKVFNRIFASNSSTHKKDIIHGQVGSITVVRGWFDTPKSVYLIHITNRLKGENHMVITDAEKVIEKNPTPSHNKIS